MCWSDNLWPCQAYILVLGGFCVFFSFFFLGSLRFSVLAIVSFADRDRRLYFSFPNSVPFIFFLWFIDLARIFSAMLNKSDVSGHPFLVPDLKGNAFCLSPISMMLSVGFFKMFVSSWGSLYLLLVFWDFENHPQMLNFIKCFFCMNWYDPIVFLG